MFCVLCSVFCVLCSIFPLQGFGSSEVARRATSQDPKPSCCYPFFALFFCFCSLLLCSGPSGTFRVRWGLPPHLTLNLCLFCFSWFVCSCGLSCICCSGFRLWTKGLFFLQFWCFILILDLAFFFFVCVCFWLFVFWSGNVFCIVFCQKKHNRLFACLVLVFFLFVFWDFYVWF